MRVENSATYIIRLAHKMGAGKWPLPAPGGGGSILPPDGRAFHSVAALRQRGEAAVKGSYQVASAKDRASISDFLSREGQALLPSWV